VTERAVDLLDRLIAGWSGFDEQEQYYVRQLAPRIVDGTANGLTAQVKGLIAELKDLLSEDEWNSLPDHLDLRRQGLLEEFDSDRARRLETETKEAKTTSEENESLTSIERALEENFLDAGRLLQPDLRPVGPRRIDLDEV
jgi:hypothetical protein